MFITVKGDNIIISIDIPINYYIGIASRVIGYLGIKKIKWVTKNSWCKLVLGGEW